MLHGNALPGATSWGSNYAPIFGWCLVNAKVNKLANLNCELDMQLQQEKEREEKQQ